MAKKDSQILFVPQPEIAGLWRKLVRHSNLSGVDYFANLVKEAAAGVVFCEKCGEIVANMREINLIGTLEIKCRNCGSVTTINTSLDNTL